MPPQVSRSATLFVVCTAHFLMPFMMSAVGVALPAIGREFAASALQLGLVETTYVLSLSIFLLSMGRLGDIHGRRRIFQTGIVIFTIVGGLLSQAWSIESLIGLRFLQGMGGAMVMATSIAIVVSVFPPEERGKALGIAVASVYAGISCGPFFGGMLVTALGWRWLFYICVPLGVTLYIITCAKLRGEWADAKGEPFDWQGSLVYAGGILLLIVGASHLDHGPWAWAMALAGLVGLALFLALEARTDYPVLNIALLRENRIFALSNLAALLNYAATFGVTFFLSLYCSTADGMTPAAAPSYHPADRPDPPLSPLRATCRPLPGRTGRHRRDDALRPWARRCRHPRARDSAAAGGGRSRPAWHRLRPLLLPQHQRHHGERRAALPRGRLRDDRHHANPRDDDQHDHHHRHLLDADGWSGRHCRNHPRFSAQHACGAAGLLRTMRCRHLLLSGTAAKTGKVACMSFRSRMNRFWTALSKR
jgi:MFS family permease